MELRAIALLPVRLNSCCCFDSGLRRWPTISKRKAEQNFRKYSLQLDSNCSNARFGVIGVIGDGSVKNRLRAISASNSGEPHGISDIGEEVTKVAPSSTNQLQKRIVSGLGIGVSAGVVVLAGGWIYTLALAAAVFVAATEYFDLVRSRGISSGMTPPPRFVSGACSVICCLMPILTLYSGNIDVSVTFASFFLATALVLQRGENPRFSQLTSSMFGLLYCGFLPCFWVKLRCGLAAPIPSNRLAASWPILLGGQTTWNVGLAATLMSISSIIAADTFAFVGGKVFGRTRLTAVSPKKTWEGAVAGLSGCIATSLFLGNILCWPSSVPSCVTFGFLNFFGSLFGDLIESVIKRDAGVKDSGSLIPGHGGVLDRTDSYIFTAR